MRGGVTCPSGTGLRAPPARGGEDRSRAGAPVDRGRDLGEGPGARDGQGRRRRAHRVVDRCGLHPRAGPQPRRRCRDEEGCPPGVEALAVDGEALGRSRGGLTTKVHLAVDGRGLLISVALTPGRGEDNLQLLALLESIRVPRTGPGRPRKHPEHVIADKACSHVSTRAALRARRLRHTISKRSDQIAYRRAKGAGWPAPAFDQEWYRGRNVVERCFARLKQYRPLVTRYAKRAAYYQATLLLIAVVLWLR